MEKQKPIKKQQWLQWVFFLSLLALVLHLQTAFAAGGSPLPLPDASKFGENVPVPEGDTALEQFANLVGGYRAGEGGIIGVTRMIIGGVAVLMIIISALQMLFSDGEEGKIQKAKNGIYYGIVGLGLISVAGEVTKILSLSDEGIKAAYQTDSLTCAKTILNDTNTLQCRAKLFNRSVQIGITFIKYIIGAFAIFEIIVSSFHLVGMGGEPEKLADDKKKLLWGIVGLALVIFSDTFVGKVFYKLNFNAPIGPDGVKPALDPSAGVAQIVGFTNFIISIVGPLAILALIGGGVMYMLAGGDETKIQQAKRIIFAALIGIVVIYGAFALVSTVISGQFS